MELKNLIEKCYEDLFEEAVECWTPEIQDGYDTLNALTKTKDGKVSMFYYKDNKTNRWCCEVEILHSNNNNDHEFYNLIDYLEKQLSGIVDWQDVEERVRELNMDEYQRNGFRDAKDFWDWKEG